MKTFHLAVVTPDGEAFNGEAKSILLRTSEGNVEIMAGHTDYLAKISTGACKITTDQGVRLASCSGGFISVADGKVSVVATTFEFAEDIDINRAKAAKEKAEAILQSTKDINEATLVKAKLMRALSRIDVANSIKK